MNEAPRIGGDEADGLARLKSLLFRGESDRLKSLEANVEALDERVGSAPRLEASTAEVLVEALRRAEVARHRELALAIAPVVVASIRNEIQNSRETMVETLYPITGQMVVAAVANAIREALASINERLDRATSLDRLRLRTRALLSGRPAGELALADQARPRLLRALFLERASGALIAAWRADGETENRGELIGGLLAALSGFARDALGESGGDLRTLEFGGRDIYVHTSPAHLIACETSAPLRAEQKQTLDRDCLDWLALYANAGSADDRTFGAFVDEAVARARPAKKPRKTGLPLKIVGALLLLVIAAYVARGALRSWRDHQLRGALAQAIEQRPALGAYPLTLSIDHGAGRAQIAGLAPSKQDADWLAAALAETSSGYAISTNVALVATDQSLEAASAKATADVAAIQGGLAALSSKLAALERDGAKADELASARAEQSGLAASVDALTGGLAAERDQLGALQARADTPRARLAALIDGVAVFFDRDRPLDQPGLGDRLDAIARLMSETGLSLRAVGYTDNLGSASGNQAISAARAESLAGMLFSRGVARDRVAIVGRSDADPIAAAVPGSRERNRRAVFEMIYDGEPPP